MRSVKIVHNWRWHYLSPRRQYVRNECMSFLCMTLAWLIPTDEWYARRPRRVIHSCQPYPKHSMSIWPTRRQQAAIPKLNSTLCCRHSASVNSKRNGFRPHWISFAKTALLIQLLDCIMNLNGIHYQMIAICRWRSSSVYPHIEFIG